MSPDEKQQYKEAIKQQMDVLDLTFETIAEIELPIKIAVLNRQLFEAHKGAGFNEEQAFELTKNINFLNSVTKA